MTPQLSEHLKQCNSKDILILQNMNHEIVINSRNNLLNYWKNLWEFRGLCTTFAWRDITVRYKQTFLGIAWSIIRPLLSILIFTFVFHNVAKLSPSGKSPYILTVFCGMIPWLLFSSSLTSISESLTSNSSLVSKIYFPRLILPLSTIAAPLIDFLISMTLMFVFFAYYSVELTTKALIIPPLTVLVMLLAFGPGLIFCTLNVSYRDFRLLLPFLIQVGLYLSPIGYTSSYIPEKWQSIYSLNPVVGIIETFRWALLDTDKFPLEKISITIAFILIMNVCGLILFRKAESKFADLI